MTTQELLRRAKAAKKQVAAATTEEKNQALLCMADQLEAHEADILAANAQDMERAKGTIAPVMLDRLLLTPQRIQDMATGMREVAQLPDPVGQVPRREERLNGLVIVKTASPMGVIAFINESRTYVTSDAPPADITLALISFCHPS